MKPCPDPIELAGAEGLPSDHPLREHLRCCGRCRATLRSLEAFRDPARDAEVSATEMAMADRRLEEYIAGELLAEEPAPTVAPPRIRATSSWSRGWLTAAAVAAIAVGLWVAVPRFVARDGRVGNELRGDLVPTAGALTDVLVTGEPGGGLQVQWGPVAGAEDYEIILWTSALVESGRLAPGPGTSRQLSPQAGVDPAPAFLSVVARQGGREIARSDIVSLP